MSLENDQHSILALILNMVKTNLALMNVKDILEKSFEVLEASDNNQLSRHTLDPLALSCIMDKVYSERTASYPLYNRDHLDLYYKVRLAHSWISEDQSSLITMLQIPIASNEVTARLHVLDLGNQIHGNFLLAVVNYRSNSLRYLSNTGYTSLPEVDKKLICAKREIAITPKARCDIETQNCKDWANTLVNDFTNTKFIMIEDNNSAADIQCEGIPTLTAFLTARILIY